MNHRRLLVGIILVALLSLLMLYSSLEHNRHDPDIQYILENFETYNNTRISFTGEIILVNKSSQELIIQLNEPPYLPIKIELNNTTDSINKGDITEILGILDRKNHVTVEKILISERWKHDLIYIRSLPAIPFTLYLIFRTWKFNRKTLRFERRKTDA